MSPHSRDPPTTCWVVRHGLRSPPLRAPSVPHPQGAPRCGGAWTRMSYLPRGPSSAPARAGEKEGMVPPPTLDSPLSDARSQCSLLPCPTLGCPRLLADPPKAACGRAPCREEPHPTNLHPPPSQLRHRTPPDNVSSAHRRPPGGVSGRYPSPPLGAQAGGALRAGGAAVPQRAVPRHLRSPHVPPLRLGLAQGGWGGGGGGAVSPMPIPPPRRLPSIGPTLPATDTAEVGPHIEAPSPEAPSPEAPKPRCFPVFLFQVPLSFPFRVVSDPIPHPMEHSKALPRHQCHGQWADDGNESRDPCLLLFFLQPAGSTTRPPPPWPPRSATSWTPSVRLVGQPGRGRWRSGGRRRVTSTIPKGATPCPPPP